MGAQLLVDVPPASPPRRDVVVSTLGVKASAPHFWLTKVRYISARYTMGMTVSTPIWINVGAGQLVAHIWYPTQIIAARMTIIPIYHGISRFRGAAFAIESSRASLNEREVRFVRLLHVDPDQAPLASLHYSCTPKCALHASVYAQAIAILSYRTIGTPDWISNGR